MVKFCQLFHPLAYPKSNACLKHFYLLSEAYKSLSLLRTNYTSAYVIYYVKLALSPYTYSVEWNNVTRLIAQKAPPLLQQPPVWTIRKSDKQFKFDQYWEHFL